MGVGEDGFRRFVDGDQTGFDEVIGLYRENLIFFLTRYVQRPAVAEELAEDAFVELLLHPRRYRFQHPLKTYLFAIGRNKALNFLKRERRHPVLPLEAAEQAEISELEDRFLRREQARALYGVLDGLREDYRTVLHLLYLEGMTAQEAADVMKKTRKQVENLAYNAKKAAKAALTKEGISLEN